jgi:hypothetical protein
VPGIFARFGAGVDWLFGEVAGSVRGAVTAAEARRILGVGIASALSGASPFLATAAASRSRSELAWAIYSGFLTGVVGATVSLLHRRCDGDPGPPPPPYYGPPYYGLPPASVAPPPPPCLMSPSDPPPP